MNVTVYNNDSLEVLKTLADSTIDAVVTDPPYGLKLLGKKWDYDVPSVDFWKECLRVLKPGGFVVSFGGARTFHRISVNIEDAGFEIRDILMWLYGKGFPHGCDIGKATSLPEWDDWNTILKPAYEPIIMARKPISESTVVKNVLKWGVGAINIGANRNPTSDNFGGGHLVKPGSPRIGCPTQKEVGVNEVIKHNHTSRKIIDVNIMPKRSGRYTPNVFIDDEAASAIDAVTPHTKSSAAARHNKQKNAERVKEGLNHFAKGLKPCTGYGHADEGGASRFFYHPKTSLKEKGVDNPHPTVKPLAIMQALIRLVVPKSATIIDPFSGSGTTLVAAAVEGVNAIGVERELEYVQYSVKRLNELETEVEVVVK